MVRAVFSFLVLTLCLVQPAWALNIQGVRVGAHPDKNRLVFELSEPVQFRAFMLSSPYRLVVDLPAFQWQGETMRDATEAGITGLRHGALKPGISRVVLDLDRPVAIRDGFVLPAQGGKPSRVVIDFTPTSVAGFEQEKTNVFGALDVERGPVDIEQNAAQVEVAAVPRPAPKPVEPEPERFDPPPMTADKPLIIIDPGHGGVDPGASGKNKVHEKHVVLKLARELRDQLLATGRYRVKMTRDSDVFIRLSNRVKYARQNQGDLFVSIHADSIDKPSVHGVSIYTLSEKASDAQTAKLAARENRADLIAGIDLSVEDEEVANILMDLAMRDTMNQSKFFANKLVDVFKRSGIKTLDNTHRYAGFAVLKAPDIPSVLVEAGFMSNRKEANMLNTADYRKKVASALRGGIDAYFEQVRKNERI